MQHHGKSRRKRQLRLLLTYSLMTLAVVTISVICILLVLGYRFDPQKRDVEAGALIQLRSTPSGATISFDGQRLSFKTPGKRNVAAGPHTVSYALEGYDPWQKTVNVKAGELRWLNYARLIPEQVTTTSVRTFDSYVGGLPSPDRKWFIVQTSSSKPEFVLADLRSDTPKFSSLIVPSSSYTASSLTHRFKLEEWDFGARYVLIKHSYGSSSEYLRLDRENQSNTVNVSKKLGLNLQAIHFSGTSGNRFYALSSGALRRLDSAAGTISEPIQQGVRSFELYRDDTIAYVRDSADKKRIVGLYDGRNRHLVASFNQKLPVRVDVSSYFSDDYVAVSRGAVTDIYFNPGANDEKKFAHVTSTVKNNWVNFSNSGRFVVTGRGLTLTTYDLETKETYAFTLPGKAILNSKPLQWLDDYYMVSTIGNQVRFTEFDGTNQHVITSAKQGSFVTLSSDGALLYSIANGKSGSASLQRSTLQLP